MKPQGSGAIVQINSKSGLEGSNKNGAYAGGKFGGIGLTQSFAMELVADAIKDCSRRRQIILDPFAGSGTTVIAAEKTGRRARVLELDPLYCDVICRRFEALTGRPARLAGTDQTFADVDLDRAAEAIAKLRDHGMKLYATFVFGYDQDGPEVFDRTLEFAMEQRFMVAAFNHLQPFPGTPLYKRLKVLALS